MVFGETEDERESTWSVRAESTNQLLHTVLVQAGAQPDALIPEDTFSLAFSAATPEEGPPPLIGQELEGVLRLTNGTTGSGSGSYPRPKEGEASALNGDGDAFRTRGVDIDLTETHGQGDTTQGSRPPCNRDTGSDRRS